MGLGLTVTIKLFDPVTFMVMTLMVI